MLLLQGNQVTQGYEEITIFEAISFNLYKGDRVGLIGRNGCGKTTLIRTIIGELLPVSGHVKILGRLGYLSQDLKLPEGIQVHAYLSEYEEHPDYYMTLSRLNLWILWDQPLETLSGGEKTKVFIAKLMLDTPDVLLLDEPTNHLDQDGIVLLAEFLNRFEGAVLMVSHDRYFLDLVVNQVLQMEEGTLRQFTGNYTQYQTAIQQEYHQQCVAYDRYIKKKNQLEFAAEFQKDRAGRYNDMSQNDFQRGKAKKMAKVAKTIEKRIEMLESVDKPKVERRLPLYMTAYEGVTSKFLILAEGLSVSYDQRSVIKQLNFQVERGSRIGLVGQNGSGKSTLLKTLLGEIPYQGKLRVSQSTKIGYFSQEITLLEPEMTILEAMQDLGLPDVDARRFLGTIGFRTDAVYKRIKSLSYGEKSRIAFLKLVLGGYNLLLLDEPTNFLDIPTREKIESLLELYEGTLIFVSHDQYFIQKMADKVWRLEEGNIKSCS